jgi:hypothetical protein
MQITLNQTTLTSDPIGITTQGIYHTYLNGYMTKQTGRHFINRKDFLAAKLVRDTNKKLMIAFVCIGAVFYAVFNWIRGGLQNFFTIQSPLDITDRIEQVQNIANTIQSPMFGVVTVITGIATIAAYVLLINYLLSYRKYIELTYIGGTIRIKYGREQGAEVRGFVLGLNG